MSDHASRRIDPKTLVRARDLRSKQTANEAKLWSRLRAGQIAGLRFRRQHPVGPFVADFYCASAKLIIEIDGDTHVGREPYDANRTHYLESKGYRVMRVTNHDVSQNIEGVLEAILLACAKG